MIEEVNNQFNGLLALATLDSNFDLESLDSDQMYNSEFVTKLSNFLENYNEMLLGNSYYKFDQVIPKLETIHKKLDAKLSSFKTSTDNEEGALELILEDIEKFETKYRNVHDCLKSIIDLELSKSETKVDYQNIVKILKSKRDNFEQVQLTEDEYSLKQIFNYMDEIISLIPNRNLDDHIPNKTNVNILINEILSIAMNESLAQLQLLSIIMPFLIQYAVMHNKREEQEKIIINVKNQVVYYRKFLDIINIILKDTISVLKRTSVKYDGKVNPIWNILTASKIINMNDEIIELDEYKIFEDIYNFQTLISLNLLNISIDHNFFLYKFAFDDNIELLKTIQKQFGTSKFVSTNLVINKYKFLLSKIIQEFQSNNEETDYIVFDKENNYSRISDYSNLNVKFVPPNNTQTLDFNNLDFHLLKSKIDYYKNTLNHKALEGIRDKFKFSLNNKKSECIYNQYCYQVDLVYICNNLFGSLVNEAKEKPNILIKDIHKAYKELTDINKECNVNNYYMERKYLEFLLDERLVNVQNDFEFKKYYDFANDLLEKFESNLKWCKDIRFLPFQIPYEQTLYHEESNSANVLSLASGNSDPIDYQKEANFLSKFKNQMQSLVSIRNNNKSFQELSTLKEKIKDSEKNSIQILSIFSAIVVFSAGAVEVSVGLIKGLKDSNAFLNNFLGIFLGFGGALSIFAMVISFVFYKSHKPTKFEVIRLSIFTIILSFVLLSLISLHSGKSIAELFCMLWK